MGAAESAPAKPVVYEPSFLDAHVKKAQRHISEVETPQQNVLQGHAAVDGSDFLMAHMREVQSLAKSIWAPYDRAGAIGLPKSTMGRSSIDSDSLLISERRKVSAERHNELPAGLSQVSERPRPHVGPDSWAMQHVKLVEETRKLTPQVSNRNRFTLMSAPDSKATAKLSNVGHNGIDSWEMACTFNAKLHAPGALKQAQRGVKGTVDMKNYSIVNETKYQGNLTQAKLTDPVRHRGVAATMPPDHYLVAEYGRCRAATVEANRFQAMPAPHVAPGDLMDVHQKSAQSAASASHRVKQHSGPVTTPAGGTRPANELMLYEDDDEDDGVQEYTA